jgi:hypothetical protein
VTAALVASSALGQVRVGVGVDVAVPMPSIRFEVAPPLVVVSPGVRVVRDYDEEVFFVDGWYWCRRDHYWFRTRDYRGGWVVADRRYVPATLVKVPPGHYRHYRGGKRGAPVYARGAPPPPGATYRRAPVTPVYVEQRHHGKHKKFKHKKFNHHHHKHKGR